jgi:hypothetical protein
MKTTAVLRFARYRGLFLQGERFLAEASLLRAVLKPGMRVVDAGALLSATFAERRRLPSESTAASSMVPAGCGNFEVFARSERHSGARKFVEHYVRPNTVRSVSFSDMLAACTAGEQREPFWVLGRGEAASA